MSHAWGVVRFEDGTFLYADYNGTADVIGATTAIGVDGPDRRVDQYLTFHDVKGIIQ